MHAAACHAYRPASWDAAIASRAAVQPVLAAAADSTDSAGCPARTEHHHRHHGGRRHPLVAAMTEALRRPDAGRHEHGPQQRGAGQRPRLRPRAVGCAARIRRRLPRHARRAPRLRQPRPAARPAGGHARTARRGRQRCRHPAAPNSLSASLSSASLSVTVDGTAPALRLDHLGEAAGLAAERHRGCEPRGGPGIAAARGLPPPDVGAARRRHAGRRRDRGQHQPSGSGNTDDTSKLVAFLRQLASALRGDADAGRAGRLDRHAGQRRSLITPGAPSPPARSSQRAVSGRRQRARVQIAPVSPCSRRRAALRLCRRLHAPRRSRTDRASSQDRRSP